MIAIGNREISQSLGKDDHQALVQDIKFLQNNDPLNKMCTFYSFWGIRKGQT